LRRWNPENHHPYFQFRQNFQSGTVIANLMPAGTSVPAKDIFGAREGFLQILEYIFNSKKKTIPSNIFH
jgi:hypothetical protein